MRTGQYQRPNTDTRQGSQSAVKNAETLFETRTVAEIREVESRTRKEIEEKKEELRQLVGGSYRDLIESADKIFDMKVSCEAINKYTAEMTEGFDELHTRVADLETVSSGPSETCSRKQLYAIGSRVKYLVDTPEIIWSCLDEHAYLTGAERYLRAWEVHRLLTETTDAEHTELLASFPLLHHHWPQVETFKIQILTRSRDRLAEAHLGVDACAVALASVGMINELSSTKVLSLFLESRLTFIRQLLQNSSTVQQSDSNDQFSAPRQLIVVLQRTFCEAGQLFMEAMPGHLALFFSTLSADKEDDRLFGGIPVPEAEINAWEERRGRLSKVVAPLLSEDVTEACQQWLKQVAQEVKEHGLQLLSTCPSMSSLIELEATLHKEIAAEQGCLESMEWITAAVATPPAPGRIWEAVCRVVLGGAMDLWDTLFDSIFLERAGVLIDEAFGELKLLEETEAAVKDIENIPESNIMCCMAAVEEAGWSSSSDRPVGGSRNLHSELSRFSPEVGNLSRALDSQLAGILTDVVSMRDSPEDPASRSNRANLLQPHTQERCQKVMMELAGGLQSLLDATLDEGKATTPSPQVVERALFIGRIAVALSSHSKQIPITLSNPAGWGSAEGKDSGLPSRSGALSSYRRELGLKGGARGSAKAGSSGTDAAAAQLKKVQEAFDRVSSAAYKVWVESASSKLRVALQTELAGDATLKATAPHRGWEDTVISSGEAGEGEASDFEMKLSLPAVPSPYVIAFIFSACREIHRVGSHTLQRVTLLMFADRLTQDVLEVYGALVDVYTPAELRPALPASEKGVLQLLFDVRFLLDILCGLSASSAARTDDAKALASELEDALQGHLDPIDWATYEPYLWANEQRYYQRCAVLFGSLVQLRRLHVGTAGKQAHSSETNTLNVVATVQRFGYLPITNPSTTVRSKSAGGARNGGSEGAANGWKSNGGLAQDAGLKNEASAPLLKGLGFMGQVSSKFGLGMLADSKLKDKSAAAISSFGDMLAGTTPLTAWGSGKKE